MDLARVIEPHDADRIALISRNHETTYGVLREQIERFRGGLVAEGVAADDRVAILCGNNPYFVISYFAVIGLGAVAMASVPDQLRRHSSVARAYPPRS